MARDPIATLLRWIEKDPDFAKAFAETAGPTLDSYIELTGSVGGLALSWAALDGAIDELFEPLLQCSEAQVACILVENISTRCQMLKKLLHVEQLPPQWVEWVEALLNRTSGELAEKRNRYIHDIWTITGNRTARTDKRAKLEKAQSHRRKALRFKTQYETSAKDVTRLEGEVTTVSQALRAATKSLRLWRSQGRRPRVWKRWLPASKPGARALYYQADPKAQGQLLAPLKYKFD